tara:strand:+ start:1040 stop:1195 length:156 start_codon:yes stop_codon:yes gene_type:complete
LRFNTSQHNPDIKKGAWAPFLFAELRANYKDWLQLDSNNYQNANEKNEPFK